MDSRVQPLRNHRAVYLARATSLRQPPHRVFLAQLRQLAVVPHRSQHLANHPVYLAAAAAAAAELVEAAPFLGAQIASLPRASVSVRTPLNSLPATNPPCSSQPPISSQEHRLLFQVLRLRASLLTPQMRARGKPQISLAEGAPAYSKIRRLRPQELLLRLPANQLGLLAPWGLLHLPDLLRRANRVQVIHLVKIPTINNRRRRVYSQR